MEVRSPERKDLKKLEEYNVSMFPEKVIPAKDYLEFWFGEDEGALNECLVLQDEEGEIRGQVLASPMTYFHNQKRVNSVWLFDLIVDEDLRKDGWGVDILCACMEQHPNSCSTGSGPTALPIHLKMGNKMLGEIRKYVGIPYPQYLITSVFRGIINVANYPKDVRVGSKTFRKLTSDRIEDFSQPYNPDLFEIGRDTEFLKWRFFNNLHSYAFYKDEESDDYFVVRTTKIKRVTVMLLVDYRCEMMNRLNFQDIFNAAKKVMKKLHIGIMITGSSLEKVDTILESHRFKSIGRPRPVIGFVKVQDKEEEIAKRNFIFATLADSDGETNWV